VEAFPLLNFRGFELEAQLLLKLLGMRFALAQRRLALLVEQL
jgi:hypothetical protein